MIFVVDESIKQAKTRQTGRVTPGFNAMTQWLKISVLFVIFLSLYFCPPAVAVAFYISSVPLPASFQGFRCLWHLNCHFLVSGASS
jgi:hypothetical protein